MLCNYTIKAPFGNRSGIKVCQATKIYSKSDTNLCAIKQHYVFGIVLVHARLIFAV